MATIHYDDHLFVTALQGGMAFASLSSSGFTSFTDVLSALRQQKATVAGMVTIRLRNTSQGWNRTQTVYFN